MSRCWQFPNFEIAGLQQISSHTVANEAVECYKAFLLKNSTKCGIVEVEVWNWANFGANFEIAGLQQISSHTVANEAVECYKAFLLKNSTKCGIVEVEVWNWANFGANFEIAGLQQISSHTVANEADSVETKQLSAAVF